MAYCPELSTMCIEALQHIYVIFLSPIVIAIINIIVKWQPPFPLHDSQHLDQVSSGHDHLHISRIISGVIICYHMLACYHMIMAYIQNSYGGNSWIWILPPLVFCCFLRYLLWLDDLAVFHLVFSNDSHFHLLSLLICNPHFLSLKLTVRKGQQSLIGGDGSRSNR